MPESGDALDRLHKAIPHSVSAEAKVVPGAPGAFLRRGFLIRRPPNIRIGRLLSGGRISDFGRIPRYGLLFGLGLGAVWTPIAVYLKVAPIRYTSHLSLVLPGQGLLTSVNLSDIGQATSSSNSAFSSSSLNPAVLYKNLLESYSVIGRASEIVKILPREFGKPVIKLIDETSLIDVEIGGPTPAEAHDRADAMLTALSEELDTLRSDEAKRREVSAIEAVKDYQTNVESVRAKISALQLNSGLNSSEQYNSIVAAGEALRGRVAETEATLRNKSAEVEALSATVGVGLEIAALTIKAHADPEVGALAIAAAKSAADVADLEKQLGLRHPKLAAARTRAEGDQARLIARGVEITGLDSARFLAEIELTPSGERAVMMSRLVASTAERDGLKAQFVEQSAQLAATEERVRNLVETAAKLDALNRDYKVADAVFASALARINTSKSDLYASYPLVQLAEPASFPDRPSSPSKTIAAVAGVGASLLLLVAMTLAWLRRPLIEKMLDRKVSMHV